MENGLPEKDNFGNFVVIPADFVASAKIETYSRPVVSN